MKACKIIAVVLAVLILASCGSSTIVLTNTKRAYPIYINGENRGTGEVKIQRSGLPQKITVDVKNNSGEILAHEVIRRDINVLQFAAGFFYLYPLWFWSWKYDKKIEIFVPTQVQKSEWDSSPSSTPSKSKWD